MMRPEMRSQWWVNAQRFCLGYCNLQPRAFWRLTLPELNMLISARLEPVQSPALPRSELENLMDRYPDNPETRMKP